LESTVALHNTTVDISASTASYRLWLTQHIFVQLCFEDLKG
jgi:hypothetical protein